MSYLLGIDISTTGNKALLVSTDPAEAGKVVGVAQVGSDGTWSLTAELDEPGEHEIVLQALDASGEVVVASEPASLTVAAALAAPVLDRLPDPPPLPKTLRHLNPSG